MAQVALLMGSKNDFPKLSGVVSTLKEFDVELDVRVMSAHRTPHAQRPTGWRSVFGVADPAMVEQVDAVVAAEFERVEPEDWK